MRLLIWILGVICTLHALMTARAIAPAWVWVFWVWLGLWVVVGVVVLSVALVRAAAGSPRSAALHAPAPPVTAKMRDEGRI